MRILFCNYEYPPLGGGGGVFNALLAEELASAHEVTVLTSKGHGQLAEETVGGVRVIRVPVMFRRQLATANFSSMLAYVIQGIRSGRQLLKSMPFDVINTHFALPSGPVGDALSHEFSTPNVLSLHGGDLYDPSKWSSPHRHAVLRAWIRRLLRRADHVVAQSADTVANAHRLYVSDLEITCIPLAIRRPPAPLEGHPTYVLPSTNVLLVTVGRLVPRKALSQLLEVLAELPSSVGLAMIGGGPEELQLRERVAELDLADRVAFLGQLDEDEKFQVLRSSDIYVSTSQHEGFGLVFLEAMACGLPVVCYDHGGQTDFLEDGVTGGLIRLNDRAAFTSALRALIDSPATRSRIGVKVKEIVEAYFADRCAERYLAIFEQAVRSYSATSKLSGSSLRGRSTAP